MATKGARKPKIAPPVVKAPPVEKPMYGSEYDALLEAFKTPSFRKAMTNYCAARRDGAGQTMLLPSNTPDQLQIIRGKAQAFFELLAMCELAKASDDQEGE